jgi:hypothetical protein
VVPVLNKQKYYGLVQGQKEEMVSYHFFQIEIENSYFVPFRRLSTKQRMRKAPVGSSGFVEPIESALERCAWV